MNGRIASTPHGVCMGVCMHAPMFWTFLKHFQWLTNSGMLYVGLLFTFMFSLFLSFIFPPSPLMNGFYLLCLHSRHGGHPAAPSLACWLQLEHSRPARAGRQPPLPRHETFVHIRLCLHFLLLHPFFSVSPTCILHFIRWCGLRHQFAAKWGAPDEHGIHKHAKLQKRDWDTQYVQSLLKLFLVDNPHCELSNGLLSRLNNWDS